MQEVHNHQNLVFLFFFFFFFILVLAFSLLPSLLFFNNKMNVILHCYLFLLLFLFDLKFSFASSSWGPKRLQRENPYVSCCCCWASVKENR